MAVYDINGILVRDAPGQRAKTSELRVQLG